MTSGNRAYLNLTAGAWRQLRRSWNLPLSPLLLWQSTVTGPVLSAINRIQQSATAKRMAGRDLAGSVFIVGYWRSGTTLLHELLCNDPRYTFPTTYACINPHHFMLTQPGQQQAGGVEGTKRPMDDLVVHADSPQEDEFALLGFGARSPYEAFLTPSHLAPAMALGDPRDLTGSEQEVWRSAFLGFLQGVSHMGGNLPIIAKSPTHSYRIGTICELVPDARFILVVRDPLIVFESAVRMWQTMMTLYALGAYSDHGRDSRDSSGRTAALRGQARGRPHRSWRKQVRGSTLRSACGGSVGTIEQLYAQLQLGDFDSVRLAIDDYAQKHVSYRAKSALPPEPWRERVEAHWGDIRAFYGYGP